MVEKLVCLQESTPDKKEIYKDVDVRGQYHDFTAQRVHLSILEPVELDKILLQEVYK